MHDDGLRDHVIRLGASRLHCTMIGEGRPVMLVHGWPTSAFLWRRIATRLAPTARVIVPDLPGFGRSDKPDVTYSLDHHATTLEALRDALGLERISLVLHDLGGPAGLLWAVRHPERVERLVLLNTVVYPDGAAGRLFWPEGSLLQRARAILGAPAPLAVRCSTLLSMWPALHGLLYRPFAVALTMRLGARRRLPPEIVRAYQVPFTTAEARRALAKTLLDPRREELEEIRSGLGSLRAPALLAYGAQDRLIPGIAEEMGRLARDLPAAQLRTFPEAGHFLQEDAPEELGRLLEQFLLAGEVERQRAPAPSAGRA